MQPLHRFVLAVSLSLAACGPASSESEAQAIPSAEATPRYDQRPVPPEAIALHDSARAVLVRFAHGRADTTALRRAIADARRAHSFDPRFVAPLQTAFTAYGRLGELDSAVAVLELGVEASPPLGETIGFVRYQQGRREEATGWFENARAYFASLTDEEWARMRPDPSATYLAGVLEAQYVRVTWLSQGEEAARGVLEGRPPGLREAPQVRFIECAVETATPAEYIGSFGYGGPVPESEPGDAMSGCGELLFEDP